MNHLEQCPKHSKCYIGVDCYYLYVLIRMLPDIMHGMISVIQNKVSQSWDYLGPNHSLLGHAILCCRGLSCAM